MTSLNLLLAALQALQATVSELTGSSWLDVLQSGAKLDNHGLFYTYYQALLCDYCVRHAALYRTSLTATAWL